MSGTSPAALNLAHTKKVGDRTYAYLYSVTPADLEWYYLPYGTAQTYLSADPRSIDWQEFGRRYGINREGATA